MIRDIIHYGDERLLAANAEVDPASPELPALLADMVETCHAAPGIGLAAPQIGINPVILESSGEQREEEGCLSVPDLTERVVRPAFVRARAADAAGQVREIEGTDLLARALCHEIDHLNRILYIDRLRGLKREMTRKKLERRARRAG